MSGRATATERHPFRAQPKPGEALAIRADIDLASLFGEPIVENYERNGACVVTIRGPLEHHASPFGDSYECIRERFGEALASDHECIILRIDSPGGVVSGLNEAVYDMTRAKETEGKHVIAYCDELIASAAYALSCVADEVWVPPSGIIGSIGVISMLFDTVGADKKAGVNWVTITSGARKDDGHPHTTISEDAIDAERERVQELAAQFFAIVKEARGIEAAPLQAGLFLGEEAVERGVATELGGWEKLLVDVAEVYGTGDTTAQPGTPSVGTHEAEMGIGLSALIKRTEKAIVAETSPRKRAALMADLEAYKKTKHHVETRETEEDDDEEEAEEGGNDTDRDESARADDMPGDDDKKKERKGKKAKAKARAAEDDEEARAEEEDEEEEEASAEEDDEDKREERAEEDDDKDREEAVKAMLAPLKGRARAIARGTLRGLFADAALGRKAAAQVREIAAKTERAELNARVDAALAKRLVTKKDAAWLKSQPKATVESYLKTRKTPIIFTDDDAPRTRTTGDANYGGGQYSQEQMDMFRKAAAGMGKTLDEVIKFHEQGAARANGINGAAKFTPPTGGN